MSPDSPTAWLDQRARQTPEGPALIVAGRTTSFRRLREEVGRLAAHLDRQGVGQVVAALSRDPLTLAQLALAAPAAGRACFPVDPRLPAAMREALLREAGVRRAVPEPGQPTPEGIAPLALPRPGAQTGRLWREPGPDAVSLILATSGTAGRPKAVMLTGRNLSAGCLAANACLGLAAGDRWLVPLPLFHIGGLAACFRCLAAGATAVLQAPFEPGRTWQLLSEQAISHVSLVPAMLAQLIEAGPPPPSLRVALVGGAALPVPIARRAMATGWPLAVSYGMSETASQIATLFPLPQDWDGRLLGRPLPGIALRVLDEGGQPSRGSGRIEVSGAQVMAGYANPALAPGMGLSESWLTTGDLGFLDPEGLHVLGRADEVIVTGGEKLHPAQVEGLLAECPGVDETAVGGIPDPVWGERVTLWFAGSASVEDVTRWCGEHLAGHYRPRRFVKLARLPRTAAGKVDRQALPRNSRSETSSPSPASGTSPKGAGRHEVAVPSEARDGPKDHRGQG